MSRRYTNVIRFSFAVLASCIVSFSSATADVIHIDTGLTDPRAIPALKEAESIWESRIKAYSSELPRGIRDQLTSNVITARVGVLDGPGNGLAAAGPEAVVSMGADTGLPISKNNGGHAVAVRSMIIIDFEDIDFMIATGILVETVTHEIGHALGFGTLFDGADLIGARGGFGPTEYIYGEYALQAYRRESGNPVAGYVPLEQRGGPGTALGHWLDAPPFFNQVFTAAFKKELMTGFAGDFDPSTGTIVFADTFISDSTWGAMADMGFAVDGINGAFAAPKGKGTGRWPKIVGQGSDPFSGNAIPVAAGLQYNLVTVKSVYMDAFDSRGSGAGDVKTEAVEDPYNLRNHRWAK